MEIEIKNEVHQLATDRHNVHAIYFDDFVHDDGGATARRSLDNIIEYEFLSEKIKDTAEKLYSAYMQYTDPSDAVDYGMTREEAEEGNEKAKELWDNNHDSLNTLIEEFLTQYDEENGTELCPSGMARLAWAEQS